MRPIVKTFINNDHNESKDKDDLATPEVHVNEESSVIVEPHIDEPSIPTQNRKTPYQCQPKVLFVNDSVGRSKRVIIYNKLLLLLDTLLFYNRGLRPKGDSQRCLLGVVRCERIKTTRSLERGLLT